MTIHPPTIRFDWTISIGHLLSVIIFIVGGISAWYDVKSDVKVFETKLKSVDQFIAQQKHNDDIQDSQRDKIATEIKGDLKDRTNEIKQEIRDLRTDLFRKPR